MMAQVAQCGDDGADGGQEAQGGTDGEGWRMQAAHDGAGGASGTEWRRSPAHPHPHTQAQGPSCYRGDIIKGGRGVGAAGAQPYIDMGSR